MFSFVGRICIQLLAAVLCIFSAIHVESDILKVIFVALSVFNVFLLKFTIYINNKSSIMKSHLEVIDQISEERKREARLKALRSPDPFPKDVEEFREFCKKHIKVDSIVLKSKILFIKMKLGLTISDKDFSDNIFCIYLSVPEAVRDMLYEASDVYSSPDYSKTMSYLTPMQKDDFKWMLKYIFEGDLKDNNGNYIKYDGETFMLTNSEQESVPISQNVKVLSMKQFRKRFYPSII
ncbi:hypothetical protein EHV15_34520 [Paenibacillus oralis]|uniref:Uncharacterized protein n=1 Tax=Paenibacillus oralis TaxID=2490856 RepID=A0A3P3TB08_9BACL|nr:hypothetical protein [Paenibacillus oralis]RRJ54714.1 hypothetical protein EHV15_34520 [Paenibacillus oralis]